MLDVDYWDLIHVQASLMMLVRILSTSKHPYWWLLRFDPCPSILDDDYCKLIHVQISLMMLIGILSMSKHTWWWRLESDQCTSILGDDHRDLIHVSKPIFGKKWPKFGHDNDWNWSHDQFWLKINKIWSRWHLELVTRPIFGKNYQNLVVMTIGIGCMTNFW